MSSDNGHLLEHSPTQPTTSRNSKSLRPLTLFLLSLLVIMAAASGNLLGVSRNQPVYHLVSSKPLISSPERMINIVTPIPVNPTVTKYQPALPLRSTDPYDVSNWETFTSPTEGFTIRYPQTWTVKDNRLRSCGFNAAGYNRSVPVYISDTPTPKYCRDSFDFISSNGKVSVSYVQLSDYSSDRGECGIQATCFDQIIDAVEELTINHLGKVYLVQYGREISVHKPVDNGTIPMVGNNLHITTTLPSTAET